MVGATSNSALNLSGSPSLNWTSLTLGRPTTCSSSSLHVLLEILGEQVFEDVFAHLVGELGANQIGGNFAGAESGQLYFLLDVRDHAIGLAGDFVNRNGDFDFVFAAFEKHGCRCVGGGWWEGL